MDSPIILLVLWFIINIVIKSAKDKKKIEESRQKRARQLIKKKISTGKRKYRAQYNQNQPKHRSTKKILPCKILSWRLNPV